MPPFLVGAPIRFDILRTYAYGHMHTRCDIKLHKPVRCPAWVLFAMSSSFYLTGMHSQTCSVPRLNLVTILFSFLTLQVLRLHRMFWDEKIIAPLRTHLLSCHPLNCSCDYPTCSSQLWRPEAHDVNWMQTHFLCPNRRFCMVANTTTTSGSVWSSNAMIVSYTNIPNSMQSVWFC